MCGDSQIAQGDQGPPARAQSTRPSAVRGTPSSASRARCSSAPLVPFMLPSAWTTRHQGTAPPPRPPPAATGRGRGVGGEILGEEIKQMTGEGIIAQKLGYPVLVRPSYVLSGAAMGVASNDAELASFLSRATRRSRRQKRPRSGSG